MAIKTFKATSRRVRGLKVESESRGFKVILDEPKNEGGTDEGMNPMEMVLCSLGGCMTIVATMFAKQNGVELEDFWIEIEGDIDTDGFMGVEGVRPGYFEVRYKMHIKSSSPDEKIHKFAEFIKGRCPVGDSLSGPVKFVPSGVVIEK